MRRLSVNPLMNSGWTLHQLCLWVLSFDKPWPFLQLGSSVSLLCSLRRVQWVIVSMCSQMKVNDGWWMLCTDTELLPRSIIAWEILVPCHSWEDINMNDVQWICQKKQGQGLQQHICIYFLMIGCPQPEGSTKTSLSGCLTPTSRGWMIPQGNEQTAVIKTEDVVQKMFLRCTWCTFQGSKK